VNTLRKKRKINFKSFLIILLILLLLVAAINLNRNLLLVNKHINETNQKIHTLERELNVMDSRYAKVYAYQNERISEIENTPIDTVTYIEEVETHNADESEAEETFTNSLSPAVLIGTLLTGLKAISSFRLAY
jgi:Tfp pilus assembly protein PilN